MEPVILFENSEHKNILLPIQKMEGLAITNEQHLIIHNGSALLLDPGGRKVFNYAVNNVLNALNNQAKLTHIFFSHQDPDVIAATNGWLMSFEAKGYISDLWFWFISHFGVERFAEDRMVAIPRTGGVIDLAGCKLLVLPAHYLHSPGNFHLYDPVSKILYTGDLGSSQGAPYLEVQNFEEHLQYMEHLHKDYMASNKAMKLWADMAKKLDIEMIVPQHGAYFKGKEMVQKFISWAENYQCGLDLIESFKLPS